MTAAHDIRLLLSDVDGTLVDRDKVLSPAAIAAARDLASARIGLTVTSARPPRGLRTLIESLGLTLPVAGFNGGLITAPDLTVIASHPIAPDDARRAVELLQTHGLDVWVYTEEEWFVPAADGPHVDRETFILQYPPVVMAQPGDAQLARAFKIVGVSDDHPKVAAAEAAVQAALGASVSATRSAPYFLDVTHPKATKGAVVHALAERLGISPEEIATIGDMPNDVLMFRESGFSIAMGNASDAVKAEADAVTDSNQDDGFAKAVRRFLIRSAA